MTGVRRKRENYTGNGHGSSVPHTCLLSCFSDSFYRYLPVVGKDDVVIAGIQAAVERYPPYGFGKLLPFYGGKATHGITSQYIVYTVLS